MSTVILNDLADAQEESWIGLVELSEHVPRDWCLVGGQMVYLLCRERDAYPARATVDADAVLDVRARPTVVEDITRALMDLGFASKGESLEGHQHRWVRGMAQIDLLIPTGLGPRAGARRGVTGGTLPETPGANGALGRAASVQVLVGSVRGEVRRPPLLGAIAMKAAAATVIADRARGRHLIDIAILSTLLVPADFREVTLNSKERGRIANAVRKVDADRSVIAQVVGAEEGLARLRLGMGPCVR